MILTVFSRVLSLFIVVGIAFVISYIITMNLIKVSRKFMFLVPIVAIILTVAFRLSLNEPVDWTEGITQYAIIIIGILISVSSFLASMVLFIKEKIIY
ncbi:MAG: hypothetical protein WC219_06660 [Acholeplasmataceae bacterium]